MAKIVSSLSGLIALASLTAGAALAAGSYANGDMTFNGNVTVTGSETITTNLQFGGDTVFSAAAPTFTSGACSGAIGTATSTAAFTVTTGSGGCGSTFTLGMPSAANGWNCQAYDEAVAGTARIQATSDTVNSVVFTNYSIGSSPAATNFSTSHTIHVMCGGF